jgi:hypothetical protein
MKEKEFKTIGEYFYWLYANMSMAHAALKKSHLKYGKVDYMIRSKIYKGLTDVTMNISSLYDDEKDKLSNNICAYCGAVGKLSLDHLIPRKIGGADSGDNLVYACKKCNSSKNDKDLIQWYIQKDEFPPILVLRRYLKLTHFYLKTSNLLEMDFNELKNKVEYFRIDLLPYSFPSPDKLKL